MCSVASELFDWLREEPTTSIGRGACRIGSLRWEIKQDFGSSDAGLRFGMRSGGERSRFMVKKARLVTAEDESQSSRKIPSRTCPRRPPPQTYSSACWSFDSDFLDCRARARLCCSPHATCRRGCYKTHPYEKHTHKSQPNVADLRADNIPRKIKVT